MSQRQIRLAFVNSKIGSNSTRRRSAKCNDLPEHYGMSSFQRKVGQLEKEKPAAAALLEQLIDDALQS